MTPPRIQEGTTIKTDVLVVGSGLAGLRAAIEARRFGVEVLVLDKSIIAYNSSSRMSGGHLKAAAAFPRPFTSSTPSSPEQHFKDKVLIGEFILNQRLAEIVCYEGPARKQELRDFGVRVLIGVDPNPLHREYSFPHGIFFMPPLVDTAMKMGINFYKRIYPLELLVQDGRVVGIYALDLDSGHIMSILCKALVLACGGAAELYKRNDTPVTATGDGYALAYRIGLPLIDMEMIHFEPFVHAEPDLPMMDRREAIAAWYGTLRNSKGEDFLPNYFKRVGSSKDPFHEQYGAYNPDIRHFVSRAMGLEVFEGRGDRDAVFFDLTEVPDEKWEADRPSGYLKYVLCRGYDTKKQWIHVMPGVVTTLGGLMIDEEGRTEMSGLFAAGEVTGNVHGAARLGGDALIDCVVFGARAGAAAARWALQVKEGPELPPPDQWRKKLEGMLDGHEDAVKPIEVRDKIKEVMWRNVGIIRTKEKIEQGLKELEEIRTREVPRMRASNLPELRMALEVENMILLAELVAKAALLRDESRGVHFRYDHPFRDDERWLKSIVVRRGASGQPSFYYKEPVMHRYTPSTHPLDTPISRVWLGVQEKMEEKFGRR